MKYCILYQFHHDGDHCTGKIKEELSKFNKTFKLQLEVDNFSSYITCTDYSLTLAKQEEEYINLRRSITKWHRECTERLIEIEKEKNNAKI